MDETLIKQIKQALTRTWNWGNRINYNKRWGTNQISKY